MKAVKRIYMMNARAVEQFKENDLQQRLVTVESKELQVSAYKF